MSSVKSYVTLKEKYDRVVVLIDMDCFYCQVEEFLDPKRLTGKPIAVVQYLENAGIIAVNYAARALGVTRHMREREAKAFCKDLICVKVPSKNGKADLAKYRDAGYQVAKVLQSFTPLLERASVDEAYLDITDNVSKRMQEMREGKFQLQPANFVNTFAVGYDNIGSFVQDVTSSVDKDYDDLTEEERKAFASSKLRLLVGASIVNEIRSAVKAQTKYECSAGIAHNKILAKLTCGFNKPNKQTILPIDSVTGLFKDLEINKVKSMGGKLGEEVCEKLQVKTMADLLKFTEGELQQQFQGRVGSWLFYMARGIDLEKVTPKFMSKSIAVSKNFRGKNEIASVHTLKFWLKELSKEIVERLEKDAADCNRTSKHLVVSFTQGAPNSDTNNVSSSRTVPLNGNSLNSYTVEQIADEAFDIIKKSSGKFLKAEGTVVMSQSIKHLGITAGKFEDNVAAGTTKSLQELLKNHKKVPARVVETPTKSSTEVVETIKKFEMKSPKSYFAVKAAIERPEPEHAIPESVPPKPELEDLLESSAAFAGENSIRGIKTLKHWIAQLLLELCGKLEADSATHHRVPKEISLRWTQQINGKLKTNSISCLLEDFADDVIDSDVFAEKLMSSEGFTQAEGGISKIQHPITQLTITPLAFEVGDKWKFKLKGEKVQAEVKLEAEVELQDADSTLPESDEEIPSSEPDDELSRLEAELAVESEEEFEPLGQAILDEIQASPSYDDLEDEIPQTDDVERKENSPAIAKELEMEVEEPTNSNQKQTTEAPSYVETYAEFQPQQSFMDLLNPKQPCVECGKMIGRLEMTAHLDHHLAFQIAHEQREEYRKQVKSSTPSTSSSSGTKKVLKPKINHGKLAVNSIKKYAIKTKREETPDEDASAENKVKCLQCLKAVASEDFMSHMDYHYAKQLREDEMKASTSQKVDAKRKKPSTQKKPQNMKSMKSYFATN